MPVSFKSMGLAAPVLLVATLGCWLYMLWSIAGWVGKTPPPGRGEDKAMQQAISGGAALLVWLLAAGLLVLAATRGAMPPSVGVFCWLMHPLSCLFALVGITVAYDAPGRWAVAVPAILPLLICGYALWLLTGAGRGSPPAVGFAMWGAALALGLALIPTAIGFQRIHLPKGDSVEDKPGPELDAFKARQQESLRQQGLETIRKVDEDTTIGELENLTYENSPVRNEALEAIRNLPHKQTDMEKALAYQYSFWPLRLLPEIDVQATPTLCEAARQYLRGSERQVRSVNPSGMGIELQQGIPGIQWIMKHCECAKEIQALNALAAEKEQTDEVRRFREALQPPQ